jgi:Skp family chaperone for outer membrane proteins
MPQNDSLTRTTSSVDISVMSMISEAPTPSSKTSEALKTELQAVNRQLTLMKKEWQEERRGLLGEKAVLQDAANRLNLEVQDAKSKIAEKERERDRATISVQEVNLQIG